MAPAHYKNASDDLRDKLAQLDPGEAFPDPIWVPVDLRYDDLSWGKVGMRYRGNTSLAQAWQAGIQKLSFRLSIDKYEGQNPELQDQRFFGFKKLVFANGYGDPSLIREKLALSIFEAGGVPVAKGVFVRVYVDSGLGLQYYGLYTMIEDPSNKMLESRFGHDGGNLYKPEGNGARLKTFVRESMTKKTNEGAADWSEVVALIEALHADRTDAPAWREALEKVFDVAGFLKYLAINQAMQNWDSYGFMAHNYYLYADPGKRDRLAWIPWDLTVVMTPMVIDQVDTGSVLLAEVSSDWPLIRYVLDDAEYLQIYKDQLEVALESPLSMSDVLAKMDAYHDLIKPHVVGTDGETAPYSTLSGSTVFEQSLSGGTDPLKPHLRSRHSAVWSALGL